MKLVPCTSTCAAVAQQLPALVAFAERHGWRVDWKPDLLKLVIAGKHPSNQADLRVIGDLMGFPAVPPAWTFEDARGVAVSPKGGTLPSGRSSIFHSPGMICAPFNRLAYEKEKNGPHPEWNDFASWMDVRAPNQVYAVHLADMFATILVHLNASPGLN